ncbi:MAG: hypothetical protein FWG84_07795 [Bacteroidales bacterium]|nr:hypothetical protein [Bacteroidales bacterium]
MKNEGKQEGAFQIVVVRHCERSEAIQSYGLRVTSYFLSTEWVLSV